MNVEQQEPPSVFFLFGGLGLFFTGLLVLSAIVVPDLGQFFQTNAPFLATVYRTIGVVGMIVIMGGATAVCFAVGLQRLFAYWGLGVRPSPKSVDNQNLDLMLALDFAPEDLEANQQGQLSPAQEIKIQAQVRQMRNSAIWSTVFGGVMFGGVILFIVFGPDSDGFRRALQRPMVLWVYLLVFALMGGLMFLSVLRMFWQTFSWRWQPIRRTSGKVYLTKQRSKSFTICTLRIAWRRFYLTEHQINGFWHGQKYHIYFMTHWVVPTILSAEVAE